MGSQQVIYTDVVRVRIAGAAGYSGETRLLSFQGNYNASIVTNSCPFWSTSRSLAGRVDYISVDLGEIDLPGELTLDTCNSLISVGVDPSLALLEPAYNASAPAGSVTPAFTCRLLDDNGCGLDNPVFERLTETVTSRWYVVAVASGIAGAAFEYRLSWRYSPSSSPTPSRTVAGTSSSSRTATGSSTATVALTATASATATSSRTRSRVPTLTPARSVSPTPPVALAPTCNDPSTGSPYPFRSVLIGNVAGSTPVHVNNAGATTRVYSCPGIERDEAFLPFWLGDEFAEAAVDYHVVDMGADTPLYGDLTVDTCDGRTEFDTLIWVRTACPNQRSVWGCIAQNDNGLCGGQSFVTFRVESRFMFVAVASSVFNTTGREFAGGLCCSGLVLAMSVSQSNVRQCISA
jgi:hypothetical protein